MCISFIPYNLLSSAASCSFVGFVLLLLHLVRTHTNVSYIKAGTLSISLVSSAEYQSGDIVRAANHHAMGKGVLGPIVGESPSTEGAVPGVGECLK